MLGAQNLKIYFSHNYQRLTLHVMSSNKAEVFAIRSQ